MTEPKANAGANRRDFLRTTAAAAAGAASLGALTSVHAAGSDEIKVGLIGCGGRGTGAAEQSATSDPGIRIVALADTFEDHLNSCRSSLKEKIGDKFAVKDDHCFVGFDAYQKLIDSGVDLVLLATPPGFRPTHLKAAIDAGKHVFTEKPVGVDGPGIRSAMATADEAKRRGLAIVAGTQRRHQAPYLESMKAIHDGTLGEVTSGRCYWNQGSLWNKPREDSWSDAEWQLRNWLYFTWLSGDHIVEQHVHNLDVLNWAIGAHPDRAVGMGGRQVRIGPEYGHIYDHFAVEYEYPNGVSVQSFCRQIPNCENNVSETVVGTKGAWTSNGYRFTGKADHDRIRDKGKNPYEQEHIDLVESIRKGTPLNELKTVAESTLTAIMGRMSTYTGKAVTWDEALNSKQVLMPEQLAWGPMPVPPVAMPGVTELI